ncbi:HTH_38 domain-containing protein [Trichonephila clavipes]|nr:HTH_38 domain-containing protein [Trichonephila clavipes]
MSRRNSDQLLIKYPSLTEEEQWPTEIESTKDQRGRSHPPQCTTSREDRQIVRRTVADRLVTARTVAQRECNALFSVCAYHSTSFTADWSVRKTSIAWSTLDTEPQSLRG